MVAHTFNPSTSQGRGRQICELYDILVYKVSFRIARATQRNLALEKKGIKEGKKRGQELKGVKSSNWLRNKAVFTGSRIVVTISTLNKSCFFSLLFIFKSTQLL